MSNGYLISDYFENGPGAVVYAWKSSRFGGIPAQGDAPPGGSPDGGPITVGSTFGGPGAFQLHVPDVEDYYVQAVYSGVNYWKLVAAGALAFAPPLVGQVLSLSYWDGSGESAPFPVPCFGVPNGYSGGTASLGAQLIIGAGGITSGVLLDTDGSPLPDGFSFPASIFVEGGVIYDIIAINPYNAELVGGIVVWGDTGDRPIQLIIPGGINTPGTINAGAVVTNGFQVNGVNVFAYGGDPNTHVASITEGDLVFDTGTPAIWQATAASSSTDWVQIGSGGGAELTVNSGPVVDSGLLPLQITTQPLVPPSGIIQPLPPLFGFMFPGTVLSYALTGSAAPWLCAGRDGNLWVADANAQIWKVTTAGVATAFSLGATPYQICSGSDGNLYVTDQDYPSGPVMWQVPPSDPAGAISFQLPTGYSVANVCAGPDGNLYVALQNLSSGPGVVAQVTTGGTVTPFTIGETSIPYGLCAGPDGNVYVVDNTGFLWQLTTEGVATQIATIVGNITEICTGPDGNLWVSDATNSRVYKVTPGGTVIPVALPDTASPAGIAVGGGGDIWVTDSHLGAVYKITTEGVVSAFSGVGSAPQGIAVGADGSLWICDQTLAVVLAMPFTVQMGQLILTALAGSDPAVVGALWNNGGVVNVSAG
jgi:virginiamycin B lyase